jgi:hypothetical protein
LLLAADPSVGLLGDEDKSPKGWCSSDGLGSRWSKKEPLRLRSVGETIEVKDSRSFCDA